MINLIERARYWTGFHERWGAVETAAILRDLADEIERLRAGVGAAERERDEARAEIERLRRKVEFAAKMGMIAPETEPDPTATDQAVS